MKRKGNIMKPIWQMFSGLIVLTSLAGCASFRPTDPYAGSGTGVFTQFHTGSADAQEAQAEVKEPLSGPVDLSEAVAIALKNNPDIGASGYDIAAAQARKDQARAAMLPDVSAIGGYNRFLDDQRLIPARYNGEPGAYSTSIFAGDIVLRMPLYTGGRRINEIRAATLLEEASRHRLGRSREEIVFNVSSVFYAILAQQKVIDSLLFAEKTLNSHLKRVNDLIAAQKAAKVDRLRTEVRLADVRQKIVREKNTLAVQKQLLVNFMGIGQTHGEPELQGSLDTDIELTLSMEDGLSSAYQKRPDYLAVRKELEAQARRVDVARGEHLPTVSLFGTYGGRWAVNPADQPGGAVAPSASSTEDVGSIGIGLEIPIFEGGRIQARVAEERAKLAAAQERMRKLELQIRLEVESAVLNFTSAGERVRTLRKSVEQAEESLRIERQKYEVGKGAIVDVLDAQSALLDSETNYYGALADVQVARAQIDLAIGEEKP
jgi:outer membrane protein TolC